MSVFHNLSPNIHYDHQSIVVVLLSVQSTLRAPLCRFALLDLIGIPPVPFFTSLFLSLPLLMPSPHHSSMFLTKYIKERRRPQNSSFNTLLRAPISIARSSKWLLNLALFWKYAFLLSSSLSFEYPYKPFASLSLSSALTFSSSPTFYLPNLFPSLHFFFVLSPSPSPSPSLSSLTHLLCFTGLVRLYTLILFFFLCSPSLLPPPPPPFHLSYSSSSRASSPSPSLTSSLVFSLVFPPHLVDFSLFSPSSLISHMPSYPLSLSQKLIYPKIGFW